MANGAPTNLTRVENATRNCNRRDALRGQPRAAAGQSLDEYPFACSAQGGGGSFVRSVPVGVQNYRGAVLSQFFQRSGVRSGDPFNVMFGP
ncbi:NucA/NucB deoxyribonuclease domain-containing protein [Demequina oxidasica]|uniref:NucA/NucB deoxyribonuclease domain-containing protein n=1 Tax=Demequina oxidasica TaxID=676199 RepID=UPI003F721250